MKIHWRWILPILQSATAALLLAVGTLQEKAHETEFANSVAAAARSPRRDGETVDYKLPPFGEHYRAPAAQIAGAINFPALLLAAPWYLLDRIVGDASKGFNKVMFVLTIALFWYWFGSVLEGGVFAKRAVRSGVKILTLRWGCALGIAGSVGCLLFASEIILPVHPLVGMAGAAWSLLFL